MYLQVIEKVFHAEILGFYSGYHRYRQGVTVEWILTVTISYNPFCIVTVIYG